MRRGAAGVEYGRPAHLLDTVSYIKECWDAIEPRAIMNCFKKAKIMKFEEQMIISSDVPEQKEEILLLELVKGNNLLQEELNAQELMNFFLLTMKILKYSFKRF